MNTEISTLAATFDNFASGGQIGAIAAPPKETTFTSLTTWFLLLVGVMAIAIAYESDHRLGAILIVVVVLGMLYSAQQKGLL